MTDCVLPVTGSGSLLVVLLAFLVLGTGVALVLGVRRRGFRGGATVVVAVALASAALVVTDAGRADAQECVPATTVAPTAATTTIAATTTAATTSTTVATTTTAATTTTTVAGGVPVPTNPTNPTTTVATTTTSSTTTTTIAAPDLRPLVAGPTNYELFSPPQAYTVTVENVGTGPTDGTTMSFTVSLPAATVAGGAVIDYREDISPSTPNWTVSEVLGTPNGPGVDGIASTVTFTSTPGFVLAAGATSTFTLILELLAEGFGSFRVNPTLPPLIGGEPAAAGGNNTATLLVNVFEVPN